MNTSNDACSCKNLMMSFFETSSLCSCASVHVFSTSPILFCFDLETRLDVRSLGQKGIHCVLVVYFIFFQTENPLSASQFYVKYRS